MKRFLQNYIQRIAAAFLLGVILFAAPQVTQAAVATTVGAGAGAVAGGAIGAIGGPVGAGVGALVGGGLGYLGGWITEAATASVLKGAALVLYFIVWVIYSFGGVFLGLIGSLLDLVVNLNQSVITNQAALTGWLTVRDLANLAIVIAVIFIAVATIIGREEYGIRKFLGKLIVMALLINFTFVISGLFVDASTVFTKFFYNNIVGKSGTDINLSDAIASSVGVSGLVDVVGKTNDGKSTFEKITSLEEIPKILSLATDLFFLAVFMWVAAIIMGNIAVLYLIRYIARIILLILAPLAWMMYAFPGLEHYAKQWWRTFLEWVFFLPVSMFFIYLAVLSMLNFTKAPDDSLAGKFTHLALGFGFLLGAMMAGKFVGGASAEMGMNFAGKMKGALTGMTGMAGGWAARKYLSGGATPATGDRTRGQRLASLLGGRGFFGAANAVKELAAPSEKLDEFKRNLAGLDDEALKKLAANPGRFYSDQQKGMIGQALANKHLLHDPSLTPAENDAKILEYARQAKQVGPDAELDVLKAAPSLAGRALGAGATPEAQKKAIERVMKRMSSDERKKINEHDLGNADVRSALNPDEIRHIIDTGTQQEKDALVNGLKDDVAAMNRGIASGLHNTSPAFAEHMRSFSRKIGVLRNLPIPSAAKREIGRVTSTAVSSPRTIDNTPASPLGQVLAAGLGATRVGALRTNEKNRILELNTKNTTGGGLTDDEEAELHDLLEKV